MIKQVKELGNSQERLFREKNILQQAVDFIFETYDIRKPYNSTQIYASYKGRELGSEILDFDRISLDLQEADIYVNDTTLRKILRSDKYLKPYNPIKEYFDKIRGTFQGFSQIDLLTKHLIARSWSDKPEGYYQERANALIKKWIVSCVACWLDGLPNEVMLTFIQKTEGAGKTFLAEWIVPEPLNEFYMKSKRPDRFDMEDAFTRNIVICFDELTGLTQNTSDIFKSTITSKTLWTKRRSDLYPVARPRLACAIANTNRNQEADGFLYECFGYRRFGCIELTSIIREYSTLCDKNLLWAEALMLYENSSFNYIFNTEDFEEFQEYNRKYIIDTKAAKYVRLYLSHPENSEEGKMLMASEICELLRKHNKIQREDMRQCAKTWKCLIGIRIYK
jgi:predicted P-loop ATPase